MLVTEANLSRPRIYSIKIRVSANVMQLNLNTNLPILLHM